MTPFDKSSHHGPPNHREEGISFFYRGNPWRYSTVAFNFDVIFSLLTTPPSSRAAVLGKRGGPTRNCILNTSASLPPAWGCAYWSLLLLSREIPVFSWFSSSLHVKYSSYLHAVVPLCFLEQQPGAVGKLWLLWSKTLLSSMGRFTSLTFQFPLV